MATTRVRAGRSRKRSEKWVYDFKAAEGSRYTDADAQRMGPELMRLHNRDGELQKRTVVDEAKSPRSKLHRYFQWDIQKAAEQNWLDTAGHIIRSIRIEVRASTRAAPKQIRAFVKLDKSIKGYTPITEVLKREDYTSMMLARALEEAEVWRKRYANLAEFTDTFQGVDVMLAHAQERLRA